MKLLTQVARFWWDFIVGDDWVIAAGVVLALAVTATLVRGQVNAWWVMLMAVVGTLALTLWRATRGG